MIRLYILNKKLKFLNLVFNLQASMVDYWNKKLFDK